MSGEPPDASRKAETESRSLNGPSLLSGLPIQMLPLPVAFQTHGGIFPDDRCRCPGSWHDFNLRRRRNVIQAVVLSRAATDIETINVGSQRKGIDFKFDRIVVWFGQ